MNKTDIESIQQGLEELKELMETNEKYFHEMALDFKIPYNDSKKFYKWKKRYNPKIKIKKEIAEKLMFNEILYNWMLFSNKACKYNEEDYMTWIFDGVSEEIFEIRIKELTE